MIMNHFPVENEEFELLDQPHIERQLCDLSALYNRFFDFGFKKIEPNLYYYNATYLIEKFKIYLDPSKELLFKYYFAFNV